MEEIKIFNYYFVIPIYYLLHLLFRKRMVMGDSELV